MSAFAPIDLNDASDTPRTFVPSTIDTQGVAKLYTAADALQERKALSLSVRLPKAGGAVARVTAKVVLPVMDGSTPPVKLGECIGTVEFVIPTRASALNREDLLAFVSNFLADPSVVAAVSDLESIY
jgi:hypothetical protein